MYVSRLALTHMHLANSESQYSPVFGRWAAPASRAPYRVKRPVAFLHTLRSCLRDRYDAYYDTFSVIYHPPHTPIHVVAAGALRSHSATHELARRPDMV